MSKYLVRFTTKGGDYDKAWCHANSRQEAVDIILHDYWNVERIDMVEKLK